MNGQDADTFYGKDRSHNVAGIEQSFSAVRGSSWSHQSNSLETTSRKSNPERPLLLPSEPRHRQSHTPPRTSSHSSQSSIRESPNVVRRDQAAAWLLAPSSQPQPQSQPQTQFQQSQSHSQPQSQPPRQSLNSGTRQDFSSSHHQSHFYQDWANPKLTSENQREEDRRQGGKYHPGPFEMDGSSKGDNSELKRSFTSSGVSWGTLKKPESGINAHTFYSSPGNPRDQASHRSSSSTSKPQTHAKTKSDSTRLVTSGVAHPTSTSHDRKHALPANSTSNANSRVQVSSTTTTLTPISKSSSNAPNHQKGSNSGKAHVQIGAELFGKKSNPSQLLARTPQLHQNSEMEEESPDPLNVISPGMDFADKNGAVASPLGRKRKDLATEKNVGEKNGSSSRPKKIRLKLGPNPGQLPQIGSQEDEVIPDSQPQVIEDSEEGEMEEDEVDEDDIDELDAFIPLNTPQSERPSDISSAQSSGRLGRVSMGPVKMSDKRNTMMKLIELIEDVLEADDALPDKDSLMAIDSGSSLPSPADTFFDLVERQPVLNSAALSKLLKYVRICARPLVDAPTRNGIKGGSSPPSTGDATQLSDIPHQELSRILRILECALKISENVDPFPVTSTGSREQSPKKKKGKGKKSKLRSGSNSRTPHLSDDEEAEDLEEAEDGQDADESDITIDANRSRQEEKAEVDMDSLQLSLSFKVDTVTHSVLAAECCLTMLAADQVPKALVSEDLIRHCVEALKVSLEKALLPFVEACGSAFYGGLNHPILEVLVEGLAPPKPKKGMKADPIPGPAAACSRSLGFLFHRSCSALTQLQKLVKLPSIYLPDSIVIAAVYVGLSPFFALEAEPASGSGASEAAKAAARGRTAMNCLGGDSAMRGLRLPSLNLLRNVFARHPNQRQWIVEEILTSLIKLPDLKKNRRQHGLRNGRTINSVNALLLQLVQTAVFGDQVEDGEDAGAVSGVARAVAELESESQAAQGDQVENDEGARLCAASKRLEGPDQTAKIIVVYLMHRVGQNKTTKSSAEVTYSSIVDNLMTDLLHTLFLPEWPASSLLLSRFCLIFAATLEDPKTSQEAKAVALEHLGTVAARLRQNEQASASAVPVLLGINKAEVDWNVEALEALSGAYRSILEHLEHAEVDDQTAESASEFFLAQWSSELSKSIIRTEGALKEVVEEGSAQDALDRINRFRAVVLKEFSDCSSRNRTKSDNVFDTRSEEDYAKISSLSAQIMPTTSFMVTFDFTRLQLVAATKEGAVGNRSRAIRGLSSISAVDSSLLDRADVRMAVEERLIDASSGVRESAIGLLGKYVLRDHNRISAHYEQLAARILDSGLGVRKRVLRLLVKFFSVATEQRLRIDACVRIVRCVNDEDVGVQSLAVSSIGEMWLGLTASEQSVGADGKSSKSKRSASADPEDESFENSFEKATQNGGDHSEAISSMASIILSVSNIVRERPSPLEEVFRRLLKKREGGGNAELLNRLRELNNTLIDNLVESQEAPAADTINRIKTIHILVSTNPTILSVGKAKLLLPYLKIPKVVEPEDLLVVELLFKVFKTCLPAMPRTASAFAESLEKSLTPLMGRPPMKPATIAMQELVACFCTTIRSHTRNYQLLVKILRACVKHLKPLQEKAAKDKAFKLDHASAQVLSLTALLVEHGNFDNIRENSAELKKELDQISKEPIVSYVSDSILALYNSSNSSFRSPCLQCLGFIFRSYPSLMLSDEVSGIMDSIFADGSTTDRELLLKIILESLSSNQHSLTDEPVSSPSRKKAAEVDRVNMDELVGNTDKFADSGVGSSLVQRYLGPILESAKDVARPSVQRAAAEIVKQIVMQGLAHPLQCVPTLIALETVPDEAIAARAFHLHSHLSSKHGSILAARYLDLARASFEFQLKQTSYSDLRGYRSALAPIALLHAWYSLLRDRRQSRLDFLKALAKSLDLDLISKECSEENVAFARYIADNLSTFDYKTLEEVFVVIAELKTILSVSGMQVFHLVKPFIESPSSSGILTSSEDSPRRPANHLQRAMLTEQEQRVPSSQPNEMAELDSRMDSVMSETQSTARMSTVMGTVLLLRNHLKSIYNLSEAKCSKYNPGKRSSAGADRQAIRKPLSDPSLAALSFDAMPLALVSFEGNTADAIAQMQTYEDLVEEEGTLNEPDDMETDDLV